MPPTFKKKNLICQHLFLHCHKCCLHCLNWDQIWSLDLKGGSVKNRACCVDCQVQDENKNSEYLCLSHNPFADVISVGLDNGHIKLFDERTLQVTSLLKKSLSSSKVDGHTNRVFCIANHPQNPHEFVSAGWDNTLQVIANDECCIFRPVKWCSAPHSLDEILFFIQFYASKVNEVSFPLYISH